MMRSWLRHCMRRATVGRPRSHGRFRAVAKAVSITVSALRHRTRWPRQAASAATVLWLCLAATGASAAELGVLAPVIESGQPLQRDDPQGRPVPVVVRVRSGELYDRLQREAAGGFTGTLLALDETAQRIAGRAPGTTWLYLSTKDGGFARSGFWLREENRSRYVAEPFVDLVVTVESVRNGDFEEIFAHELGHVFLRRLLPRLPDGYSRTAHSSVSVTDYPTAFDEGFAIHFQAMVRRHTRNTALRDQDAGLASKPFLGYWASHLDRAMRIDGVRRNLFVQARRTMAGDGDAIVRHDQSPQFDLARLKTGQQMLASEGVIATLFYRWLAPGLDDARDAWTQRYGEVFSAWAICIAARWTRIRRFSWNWSRPFLRVTPAAPQRSQA